MKDNPKMEITVETKFYCNGVLTLKPFQLKNGKWILGVIADDNSLFETLFFDDNAHKLNIIIRSETATINDLVLFDNRKEESHENND